MAAFRALIHGKLSPVGQRLYLSESTEPVPRFSEFSSYWTSSGTAGLAFALQVALRRRQPVERPAVLIPAYGCPDLVAAAIYAGVAPVLVDTEEGAPGLNPESVDRAWDENVVAIVAVNFLGIRDPVDRLLNRARASDTLVIEDCAQWYPEGELNADAVVLSFGRGKPVNLLGGGGVLLQGPEEGVARLLAPPRSSVGFVVLAAAHNVALNPRIFACLSKIPQLKIGETRYSPLEEFASMSARRLALLSGNASLWLARSRWREDALDERLVSLRGVTSLPVTLRQRRGRLLRYPILLRDRHTRDHALTVLEGEGLGASALYSVPLNQVQDVPESVRAQRGFPNAESFADRLLTLPLHDRVSSKHLEGMAAILERVAGD